jgi:hypothetical protein
LQTRAANARRCYNSALASDPTIEGLVRIGVRIGPDGSVCSTRIVASTVPADLAMCVLHLFDVPSLPAPVGGCIDAEIPMAFKPQTPPPASSTPSTP